MPKVNSIAEAIRQPMGVYLIENQPPVGVSYTPKYTAGAVMMLPWGESGVVHEVRPATKEWYNTFCPGAEATGLAYPAMAAVRYLSFSNFKVVKPVVDEVDSIDVGCVDSPMLFFP